MLRFRFLLWTVGIFSATLLRGQHGLAGHGTIGQQVATRATVDSETTIRLFAPDHDRRIDDLNAFVRQADRYSIHVKALEVIRDDRPPLLTLPIATRDGEIILMLYPTEIFSRGYHLRTQQGRHEAQRHPMAFYRGIIEGEPGSVVALSVTNDEVHLMYSGSDGNYRMHRTGVEEYVLYRERDLIHKPDYGCDVTEAHYVSENAPIVQTRQSMTGNCVEIYFECDYESYQDNGSSVANTEAWVAALFNEVSTLYENEEIPVSISDILVWTVPDPYVGLNSTSALLNEFVLQIGENGYNGRLAHLLSTRNLGGGVAYVDVLCSQSVPCGVSTSLSTNITEFPLYSWNVEVVTHELGHNFGSRHTHNCSWNGNGTQIDDCGSIAGDVQSCYDPDDPILPEDGTIMSYCHLVGGVGINFSLGFGSQPGDLIRSKYNMASCNTGVCSPPECTALSDPPHLSTLVEVSEDVHWEEVSGADGYRITMGTSPSSGDLVNNIDVGLVTMYDPSEFLPFNTNVYVKIAPYNLIGDASGCQDEYFTTEPNGAPTCTELTFPMQGDTDVPINTVLTWTHSTGNQLGYKISIGTVPGGVDVVNHFDVGNVTSYTPGSLPTETTLYTCIVPYWVNGDIEACPEISFTTAGQLYCESRGLNASEEWISSVTLGDFTQTSGAQQYSDFTGETIHVSAGATYNMSISPAFSGQSYPEYFRVWIDYNNDGIFDNPGERVFQASASSTVSGTVTIPINSQIGTKRMRVGMKWGGYSTPCQVFDYGEVEDYTLQIHCDLVTQTGDTGAGSLPWVLGCATPGETITFSANLQGDTIMLEEFSAIVSASLAIAAQPGEDIWIKGAGVPTVFRINQGIQATLTGLNIISGTASECGGILNHGQLILQDVYLRRHPDAQNSMILKNTGTVFFTGDCYLE